MLSMRYFYSSDGRAAGCIKTDEDHALIKANGLMTNKSYKLWTIRQNSVVFAATHHADKHGNCEIDIASEVFSVDNLYLIASGTQIVLCDRDLPIDKAREAVWAHSAKAELKPLCTHIEQEDAKADESYQNRGEECPNITFAGHPGDTAHDIPDVIWPKESTVIQRYFSVEDAVKMNLRSDEVYNWRFVKAKAASASFACDCILGRHMKRDHVDAYAVLIDPQFLPKGAYLPGFKYQKSPDGRGFWVRIHEFTAYA